MELVRSNEQNYQLELQSYQIVFLDFKYKPLSFVFVEIGTKNRIPTTPCVVQDITRPISPLKGARGLKIIPLPI